jgi:hypothetical protein
VHRYANLGKFDLVCRRREVDLEWQAGRPPLALAEMTTLLFYLLKAFATRTLHAPASIFSSQLLDASTSC